MAWHYPRPHTQCDILLPMLISLPVEDQNRQTDRTWWNRPDLMGRQGRTATMPLPGTDYHTAPTLPTPSPPATCPFCCGTYTCACHPPTCHLPSFQKDRTLPAMPGLPPPAIPPWFTTTCHFLVLYSHFTFLLPSDWFHGPVHACLPTRPHPQTAMRPATHYPFPPAQNTCACRGLNNFYLCYHVQPPTFVGLPPYLIFYLTLPVLITITCGCLPPATTCHPVTGQNLT